MYNPADKISVAMASYNGEKYIADQLNSIISQTHKHIEIVITDDCSSDGTVDIIKGFQVHYPYISLYQNPINKGITKAFEESLSHCLGKYIAISDQDDVWEPDKLETLAAAIHTEDAAYANSLFVDEYCQSLDKDFKSLMHLQSYFSGAPFLMGNCLPGHSILMTHTFVQTLIPFPDGIMYDRWISFQAAANNGIKYVDRLLVKYRQHATNVIGTGAFRTAAPKKITTSNFNHKLHTLTIFYHSKIRDAQTRNILGRMLQLFNKKWSLARSIFFFRNMDTVLLIKHRSTLRKILYCLKMFFKANY